jgi:NADH-quinone oxidoreductase subunit M
LSLITWSPFAFALALLAVPRGNEKNIRLAAMGASLLNLAFAITLLAFFKTTPEMQFEEKATWYGAWGISYHLGVDGVSIFLVMLNAILMPVAILCSWNAVHDKVKEFHILLLALQTAVYGVFLSLDGFLFYLFWEASLIPMYFLIGVWGGERRLYATMKFVLYTLTGSLLMLLAMVKLAFIAQEQTHAMSFALSTWKTLQIAPETQRWMFLAFFVAFAIKVPLFPFHTWLPDAHVEAPTAGSVLLAGVLLKLGSYGLMRYCLPIFPEGAILFQRPAVVLALISIIYGAAMVMVQKDFKKMVAYSSVSHMGVCILGLFSFTLAGQQGALLTMINHGISTGALFVIVGIFYERTHSRDLSLYGGAVAKMPVLGLLFLPVVMSSMGVPGTNGFVNEFLVLRGAFRYEPVVGAIAATAIILGAAYMLRLAQKVMYGPLASDLMRGLSDINTRERVTLAFLVALIFILGVFPNLILQLTEPSVNQGLLDLMRASAPGS